MFANPGEDEIRSLLKTIRTIAIVGLSPKTDRPSYRVAAGLQKLGYRVVPVPGRLQAAAAPRRSG